MPVTVINPFAVPAEISDEDFLTMWHEVSDWIPSSPGFLDATFYRNTGDQDETFRYVNVGQWESAKAYREAFGGSPENANESSGIKFYSGLFEPAFDIPKQ